MNALATSLAFTSKIFHYQSFFHSLCHPTQNEIERSQEREMVTADVPWILQPVTIGAFSGA